MNGPVLETLKKIIRDNSFIAGVYAAISPSAALDALLVNFQMVKDLIFLYGFRPTGLRILTITCRVMLSSFLAYEAEASDIGSSFASKIFKNIPFLSALSDSLAQGIMNGVLTNTIGYNTTKYLKEEYHLQLYFESDLLTYSKEDLKKENDDIKQNMKNEINKMKEEIANNQIK